MCTDCGCRQVDNAQVKIIPPSQAMTHPRSSHIAIHATHSLNVEQGLLTKNDRIAQENRNRFFDTGLCVLNLLSSPGSGKTTLIENTALYWPHRASELGVIVGDLATERDAQRLQAAGATALQITTGSACHLEADMIAKALNHFPLEPLELLFIENVGNLVCPAAYDLGETLRVILLSVTEGEDKPLKYPTAFQSADVVVLTKMDLAEAVGFNREEAIANITKMAPQATLLEVSAKSKIGITPWLQFLDQQRQLHKQRILESHTARR